MWPLLLVALSGAAHATPVRGTVSFPQNGRAETQSGHWRVPNGILPVVPRSESHQAAILFEGGPPPRKKDDDPPLTFNVELRGLQLDPRLALIQVGTTVHFKNTDRVPHTLYLEGGTSMMAPQATPAGQSRAQKFMASGVYVIRDEDFPHLTGVVLATETPFAATLDEKGSFKLDVPEGKYQVRVFWHGDWVVSQPLTVGARSSEINIAVPHK
jgi:hypothetical protein